MIKRETIRIKDGEIEYYEEFLKAEKANAYLNKFLKLDSWRHDKIKLFGREIYQPRLTALFGESGKNYTYSGLEMIPETFTKELIEIKDQCEEISHTSYNVCLANLYRDGKDSMGWHSDDEKELGKHPIIASVSLGAERIFHLKHKKDKTARHKIRLQHGSLLIMKGTTQEFWKHQLPKTQQSIGPRINLTFRKIY